MRNLEIDWLLFWMLGWIVHNERKQSPEVFYKNADFKNFAIFTGKHLRCSLFLIKLQAWGPKALQLYSKGTPTQMYSCKYCEIFKIKCFEEHLRNVASSWRQWNNVNEFDFEHFPQVCVGPFKTSTMKLFSKNS